ncbi:hypothetical protein IW140_003653 [Coemansia sp. RSA 1813]|nr:hypothetical protein EV178_002617 [Coemansia sp. RSA 1646]KAJ1770718.1 hypothetical protein LPJ74_002921 [Coemansia sp. RSA 1843]KAJ2088798.1 hypothetical protein IW138_003972 [Coemansia sp. RSA 986]KAJ2213734.1 hypothetical protein EV179_003634 [Coemansia sp. RSA 487]KAJ2568664.1 hypothetical protein IW140_003653 [Coemansia sp. RSA 1813]
MAVNVMTPADHELQQQATDEALRKQSHYYYSMDPQAQVIGAAADRDEIAVEFGLLQNETGVVRYLDEGLVATVADFWTSVVISATNGGRQSVTTSLTVQLLKPLVSDTTQAVHVVCRATNGPEIPGAMASFVDPADPAIVYATAVHTKAWQRKC